MPDELECEAPVYKRTGEFVILDHQIDHEYLNLIKNIQINPNLSKKNFKIVYSPQHGTSFVNAIRIFKKCGYDVVPVLSQCAPDPNFSGTLTPNPEDPRSYNEALKIAETVDADIICVTDPDGDRLGIAAKTRKGDYRLYTGNESGALLLNYILQQKQKNGLLSENGVMYDTIVTSSLGEKIATSYGVKTESFLTGFKYIGERIAYYEKNKGPHFEFGYEESYGCLLSPFVRDKDGIQAILMYAEMALYYKLKGYTLDERLEKLHKEFGYHVNRTYSIAFTGSKGQSDMENLMTYIRENPLDGLCGHTVVKYNDYLNQISYSQNSSEKINLDKSNVVKFIFEDGSSIAVRPSGTEPKCKFYIEAIGTSDDDARNLERDLFRDFCLHYDIKK